MNENTKTKNIVMGPMNGTNDKHPKTIIAVCDFLGYPLPEDAICGKQPSVYIGEKTLPDDFNSIYTIASKVIKDIEETELRSDIRVFKNKYHTQLNLKHDPTDFVIYFLDWLFFVKDRGFSRHDYFDFEFYNKEWEVRDTFVNKEFRGFVKNLCVERVYSQFFVNKIKFNKKFSEFIKRDWLECSKCTFEEFKEFTDKHPSFFVKPLTKSGGTGAGIINVNRFNVKKMYKKCQDEELLAEEILQQHKDLAAFNESTLNTIRVLSILDANDEPHILLGVARFGRKGNVVDNFHGGGVGAIVDVETGMIFTDAIDSVHLRTEVHPDSKLPFYGFVIPEWEKVKETIKQAALIVPEVRHVGWDVAITKDGEVALVEGNSHSGFDILQSPDQMGRRYLYDDVLPGLEKLRNMKRPEYPDLDIEGILAGKRVGKIFVPYVVEVISKTLKIRKTPIWADSDVVGRIDDGDAYIIVDECQLGSTTFGKLKNGKGWISLNEKFVKKLTFKD